MIVPLSSAVSLKRPSDAKPKPFDLLTPMGDMHPLFQSTIKDIFRRFDHDLN